VGRAFRFHRLNLPAILLSLFVISVCPLAWAQASAPNASTGETAPENSAALPLGPENHSNAQKDAPFPNIGLNSTAGLRGGCDLISAPLACLSDISRDQAGIWTAPARLRGRKLLWLAPFAAATALAFQYDVQAMDALGPSPRRIRVSNDFTHLGSGYVLAGAAGATYLFGKLGHQDRAREAGMLALESVADTTLVAEGLKLATDRQRPYVPPGTGQFWPDDVYTLSSSFPSGHAAATWALARVMVEETPGHPWLHVLMYGLATGVSIGRVTGENHFPSDALVGSVIGYAVGGYVYHHHSAYYTPKEKRFAVEPLYNPMTASYGVTLAIRP
jgi:membrane-associated phospholipid phosphatase